MKLVLCSAVASSLCGLYGCGSGIGDTTTNSPATTSSATTTTTTSSTTSPTGPSSVSAFDPLIRYIGRTKKPTNADYMLIDWSSTQMTVRFWGTSLVADLASPESSYIIAEVDGVHSEKMTVKRSSKKKSYTLAKDLAPGEHVATLWKVDESQNWDDADSALRFYGFSSPYGGIFVSPPELKVRKLDVWGASMTAGYCADGPPGKDKQIYSNYNATWARQLALMLDAEHMTEAMSGVGILHGVDGPNAVFSKFMESSLVTPSKDWDWSSWKPDALLIFLGTNDANRKSGAFHTAFAKLLQRAVDIYTPLGVKPQILHITEPEVCKDTQQDIDAFNALHGEDGFKAFEVCFSEESWNKLMSDKDTQYEGCDHHPNLAGGLMLANDVLPQVQEIMAWQSSVEIV